MRFALQIVTFVVGSAVVVELFEFSRLLLNAASDIQVILGVVIAVLGLCVEVALASWIVTSISRGRS
jgi:hypothetical protein